MTPEQYEQIREIFLVARDLNADQRAAYLTKVCGRDRALLAEVQSLLTNDVQAASFLETPALGKSFAVINRDAGARRTETDRPSGQTANVDVRAPAAPPYPERVGEYRILGVLGQGGMGVVYRAEQESPRRSVALKVIRPGIESREVLKRFAQEAEVLGWLQHSGIAQIYEAGTADTGLGAQPYFAMELVQGQPLNAYAQQRQLSIRARLELLAKLSDAVHHAHQKGVIHRDLKPGNILVDEAGNPKILDFGVARATGAALGMTTLQTAAGQLVGTIAYMSPEQVSGDPRQVDTRSDVYALGVIGYELLTGRVPVDVSEKTLPQAAQAIVEDEPTSLRSINRLYRGDVETIIAKALEKDKARRYASAADLAEDIRRCLSDQPISARPATTMYHLRKFARRNKPLVAGVVTAIFALVLGVIGTSWQAVVATRQRNRAMDAEQLAEGRRVEAERNAAIAQEVNAFLNGDLLAAAQPGKQGRDVTVLSVLDKAAKAVEDRFLNEPLVEASIRNTLGNSYLSLGVYKAAEPQLARALEQRLAHLGEEHLDTIESLTNLATLYRQQDRLDEAESLNARAVAVGRRVLGEDHPRTLIAMNSLASLYADRRRHDLAEPLYTKVLEGRLRTLGGDHPHTLNALNNLAAVYCMQGEFAKAEPLLKKAVDTQTRVMGAEHPKTLLSMNNVACVYKDLRRYDESEAWHLQTLEARRRVLGAEHPDTLVSVNNLGELYLEGNRLEEAEALFREAVRGRRRSLGDQHTNTLASIRDLAFTLIAEKKFEEAEPLALECHAGIQSLFGDNHRYTREITEFLITLYEQSERPELAAEWRARLAEMKPTSQPAAGSGRDDSKE